MTIRSNTLLLLACISFLSTPLHAKVQLTLNDTLYSYPEHVRLSDALAPVALQEDWYWPATKLFRNSTTKADNLRSQIIAKIVDERLTNSSSQSTYLNLIEQIKNWRVADRIIITIDYELARISAENNPLLESGDYLLNLSKRPQSLYIFGALKTPLDLPYVNNTCIADIVSKVTLSGDADKSHVYLISPTGLIQKAPTAYWNKSCILPMPGSQVFVPVQENVIFPSENEINQAIAELAVYRKATQ